MTVRAVDLFAGGGGLSLGLFAAGAEVVCAVEADSSAADTYVANHPETRVLQEEISDEWELPEEFSENLDLLAGGPPCQGWSTLGHRGSDKLRLRQQAAIGLFLRQVELLMPRAVLLENVRGLAVSSGGAKLAEVEHRLDKLGYQVTSALIRASDFGVPQLRHRLFVVAIRKDLGFKYTFPEKSEGAETTVADAIGDLPKLAAGEESSSYLSQPKTELQKRLRGEEQKLTWHRAPRHPSKLQRLIEALPLEGGSVRDLHDDLKPTSGFHNTYARLRSNAPAPAVTSSIGRVSSGRHVHPTQHRALTPREAARLQTFPDSYVWKGRGHWSVYEQVGNAVPPDLASTVARPLVAALSEAAVRAAA